MGEALTDMPARVADVWTAAKAAAALAPLLKADAQAGRLAAEALVEAELLGMPRFGFDLLEELGGAKKPLVTAPLPAISRLDGAGSFAPACLAEAALALVPAVHEHGMAAVFLTGIRGFGRLAPYLRVIAEAGHIGFGAAHAPAFVAPAGGVRGVVGTNPIGFAAGSGEDRLVFDTATSGITMAALKAARQTGAALPAGTAIDASGRQTGDPAEAAALMPRGGLLGSLMGLMVEVLAGVASGARGEPDGRGVFLLAIDPARIAEGDWRQKLSHLRGEWLEAEGRWPQAQPFAPDTPLPPQVAQRLSGWLERVRETGNRT